MKKLYLCTSMHWQELVEASTPQDAKTFMMNAHPDDGEYHCYAATEDDKRVFASNPMQALAPRKKFKAEQLDCVGK